MPIVTLENLTVGFRGPPLLDGISCQIDAGQRIGLLGRNGAGKTTLLRILAGQMEPDSGEVTVQRGTHISLLPQDVPANVSGSVSEIVSLGLSPLDDDLDEQASWRQRNDVEQILSRMELDGTLLFETLSSGMKRRVLIASALVARPGLLLLDEPTNHLDIQAIEWLEQFLLKWPAALMFVTHDRMFLRRMATRILEIDRGRLYDGICDYDTFLARKEQTLVAEEKQNALFDKRLAQEEAWIRQGIKARRTRNEGRVRELKRMRAERSNRRDVSGTGKLRIHHGQKSGVMVIEGEDISFGYDGKLLFGGLSILIARGDKVGIIGPNGVGKTTLLKTLLRQLKPDSGSVRHGTNLQIAYFDQLREQLDPERTVQQNVGDGSEFVFVGQQKTHVLGYLQEFLFTPERARTQVKFLSGGERNRILLARLFTRPANVLVMDEPTNDLDTETLEMLEQRLVDFAGTLLLVSHDRAFLNNVVTSTLVFEHGNVKEYVGGYDDWLDQRAEQSSVDDTAEQRQKTEKQKPVSANNQPRKLKYQERRELEQLPGLIESQESEIAQLHTTMADPAFYQQSGTVIAGQQDLLKQLQESLAAKYARWEELDSLEGT